MPLRTIPVAAELLNLVAAGPCEPLMIWAEQDGRRVLTDRQDADPETGELLWTAYVMPTGGDRPEVLSIRVRGPQLPVVAQFGAVAVDSLEVNVRVGKDGRMAQYWSAAGIRDAAPARNGHKPEQHKQEPAAA